MFNRTLTLTLIRKFPSRANFWERIIEFGIHQMSQPPSATRLRIIQLLRPVCIESLGEDIFVRYLLYPITPFIGFSSSP